MNEPSGHSPPQPLVPTGGYGGMGVGRYTPLEQRWDVLCSECAGAAKCWKPLGHPVGTGVGNSKTTSLDRTAQPHWTGTMRLCSEPLTRPRFERRLPGGRHDLIFKIAFGSYALAARALRVSKMTVWRWRHGRTPIPKWVLEALTSPVQIKVEQANDAKNQLRYLLSLPPTPPRPLSGCCAGYHRRLENRG
jgi:hypothetical protein